MNAPTAPQLRAELVSLEAEASLLGGILLDNSAFGVGLHQGGCKSRPLRAVLNEKWSMDTCLTCKHWQPKAVPEMTRHGFAPCALGSASQFQSLQHTCKRRAPADAAVADARIQWAESWRSRRGSGG